MTNDVELQVLLNEKSSTAAERQQLVSTIKQSFAFLGVILGLLLERGFSKDGSRVAFVVLPCAVIAGAAYLYANTVTLLKLTWHLENVDEALRDLGSRAPMWHADVAAPMARWGFVPRFASRRAVNPYYALTLSMVTIGAGVIAVGLVLGRRYLESEYGPVRSWMFVGLVLLECAVVVHGLMVAAVPEGKTVRLSPAAEEDANGTA